MKLTKFELFKNTPFTDMQNYKHFTSNEKRDAFFDTNYDRITFEAQFDFVKDRLMLDVNLSTQDTYGVNYCRFTNEFEGGRWYYAYVSSAEYINNNVTRLGLAVDVVTTFLQGDFSKYMNNVQVGRQSLTTEGFNKYKLMLTTNDDTINLPRQYTHQSVQKWQDFAVLFLCSVDLEKDFGDNKNPKLKTSQGQTYDGVTSPVNLYVCKDEQDFNEVTKLLQDYPWISQNINNVAMVPFELIDLDDLVPTNPKNEAIKEHLFKFKNGGKTPSVPLNGVSADRAVITQYFGLPNNTPEWVLRPEYCHIELNGWNGQRVNVDYNQLKDGNMKIIAQSMFGYHNEVRVIIDQYNSHNENSISGLYRGAYINNGIVFDVFDDIPVQVDNYKLSKANTAHQRELSNDRTISGRIKQVTNPNNNIQDRFFNALSLTASIQGGVVKNTASAFTSEYEHYREQNAELADKAIAAPSVGAQNNSQSFNISAGIFGVTAKYVSVGDYYKNVLLYHNTFGFDFKNQVLPVESVESMPIMNYIQVTGNFTIPNVPSQFVPQMKIQLENGIKLWHDKDKGDPYPFGQNLLANMEWM